MPWITLTAADVKERLANPEYKAVSEKALASGQTDPWPGILDDVTEAIRGHIGGGSPNNTLGPDGTIPSAAKRYALSAAIWDGLGRFGLSSLQTESRKADYDKAEAYFMKLASGAITVEQPETVGDETFRNREGSFAVVDPGTSTKRKATRNKTDGLV